MPIYSSPSIILDDMLHKVRMNVVLPYAAVIYDNLCIGGRIAYWVTATLNARVM